MLSEQQADVGFPWMKPDCAAAPGAMRCKDFHVSEPLVDVLIMLFVRNGDGFALDSDFDIPGKVLCRPEGFAIDDLDRDGRNWVADGLISLVRGSSARDGFERLARGDVDAVTLNVLLGAHVIDQMGLRGQVVPLERPLSSETLHALVPKTHWRGTTFLYRLNAGLAALRASGRHEEIVARHLAVFRENMRQSGG